MSLLLSEPIVFVDDDQLAACIEKFSERVRLDPALRPALDRFVGNRWADAELQALDLLQAGLFRDRRPKIDGNWLAKAARTLGAKDLDRLADIFLDCALETFPFHSVGAIAEITNEVVDTLKPVIASQGLDRQRRLLGALTRMSVKI